MPLFNSYWLIDTIEVMILIEHYARDTSVISFQKITNTCTIL